MSCKSGCEIQERGMALPGQETQKKQAGDTASGLGSPEAPRGANAPCMQRVRS